jgi:hypothetical protein
MPTSFRRELSPLNDELRERFRLMICRQGESGKLGVSQGCDTYPWASGGIRCRKLSHRRVTSVSQCQ